jgi:hypothetical protein
MEAVAATEQEPARPATPRRRRWFASPPVWGGALAAVAATVALLVAGPDGPTAPVTTTVADESLDSYLAATLTRVYGVETDETTSSDETGDLAELVEEVYGYTYRYGEDHA